MAKIPILHNSIEDQFRSSNFATGKFSYQNTSKYRHVKREPKKLPPLKESKMIMCDEYNHYSTSQERNNRRRQDGKLEFKKAFNIEINSSSKFSENPQDSSISKIPSNPRLSFSQEEKFINTDENLKNETLHNDEKERSNSSINKILKKMKDEVKPMFIFNSKFKKNDSISSVSGSDLMTPSFGLFCQSSCPSHKSRSSRASLSYESMLNCSMRNLKKVYDDRAKFYY